MPIRAKSEVTGLVHQLVYQCETQTGHDVVELHTDNGSEFASDNLQSLIQRKGIKLSLSAPYVPQQNGLIERTNQTILEKAGTILNAARVPQKLWPEAVRVASYIENRSISNSGKQTPFELWTG